VVVQQAMHDWVYESKPAQQQPREQ